MHPNDFHSRFLELLDESFGIVEAADGYILLKKGESNRELPDEFYDFARVSNPSPQYPMDVLFGGKLRLLGVDVVRYREGRLLSLRMYWQPLLPLKEGTRIYPFFLNGKGEVIETTEVHPIPTTIWYPPHRWKPGEVVAIETIPWDLGRYFVVAVGVVEGGDWNCIEARLPIDEAASFQPMAFFSGRTWAQILGIERHTHPFCRILPLERCPPKAVTGKTLNPPQCLEAVFGGEMKLWGYGIEPRKPRRGGDLTVTLYWEALSQMTTDYSIFVHLLDESGRMVAQHDGPPVWYTAMATSDWVPGERYRDEHRLRLPREIPPGRYTVAIGVYRWQDMKRLPVGDGDILILDAVLVQ